MERTRWTDKQAKKFYKSWKWQRKRAEVLAHDKHECQECKTAGRYRRAKVVHHVKELKERPDLALSMWDGDARQLLSVCHDCHEQIHDFRREPSTPVTPERW